MREELKFALLIIRFQRQFASTLKDTFVNHLKLKGLWEQYKLKEHDLNVTFNPPTYFHAAREAQIHELKFKTLSDIIQTEAVSKSYALKKYMNWTDEDLKVNREWQKKDASFAFELTQITNVGPNWRQGITGGGAGGAGGGGTAGGGSGTPPAFGPGPGGGGSALPPAGGEAPTGGEAGGETPAAGGGPEAAGGAPSALPGAQ